MADKENECQGTCSDGVDWEVVSMTASMYAAAPGPVGFASSSESKDKELSKNEKESSSPLFMSSYFVFPSMEDECLKLKDKLSEIDYKFVTEDALSGDEKDNTINRTLEKSLITESDESFDVIHFYEKEKILSVHDIGIGKANAAHEENLVLEEQVLSSAHEFHYCNEETDISGLLTCSEQSDKHKPSYSTCLTPETEPKPSVKREEKKSETFGLPFGAWLKRHAAILYNHAKEGNMFWSVVVTAALVGFAILGQPKQREKPENQQYKLHFGNNDRGDRMGWFIKPTQLPVEDIIRQIFGRGVCRFDDGTSESN